MKKFILMVLILSANVMADSNIETAQSVSIMNLTEASVDIWINGVRNKIERSSAILTPCLPNEHVEIQANENIENISCGKILEINK
ncbi:MAG: hypothetical protein CSA49_06160 [Gammaproteobacteria bacterium]|nr:MAG: hypothetical protein CSA49_06160 [Gammaproteobacteria bacterium]